MADLSDLDLRVLSHYAAGTELRSIASMLKIDVENVRELVGARTSFTRAKAGEIVRRAKGQARPPVAVLDREPPAKRVKSEPAPVPAPVVPEPDPEPEPEPIPAPAAAHSSVDAVLLWAHESGDAFAAKVDQIRALAAELAVDLEANELLLAAARRVEELREQFEQAQRELDELRRHLAPDLGVSGG